MILVRNLGREIKQIIHPRAIIPIRVGDHAIEPNIQRTVLSFFILYILIFGLGVILISFGYDIMSKHWSEYIRSWEYWTCMGRIWTDR